MPDEVREPSDNDLIARMRVQQRLAMRALSADRALGQLIQEAEERGELRHLHGQRLDISDDPNWFAARVLKEAGYAHPLVEQSRDLDATQADAEELVLRLGERRDWLIRSQQNRKLDVVHEFNDRRASVLEGYRKKLSELKTASRDFNLVAPPALHRRLFDMDEMVRAAGEMVPVLGLQAPAHQEENTQPWWGGALKRLRHILSAS